MAQYYNIVTNPNGTLTFQDVQSICTIDGQRVQILVEDINNDGNGSQQLLAYTTAPQNTEQAIFSPQAINIGSQITSAQLEQGQNVFIIKTNDVPLSPNVVKPIIEDSNINKNILNITDNPGIKQLIDCNNGSQQIQWIKLPDDNVNSSTIIKQPGLLSNKIQTANINRNQFPNSIITQTSQYRGPESQNIGPTEKKPVRLCENKSRQTFVQVSSPVPNASTVINSTCNRLPNSGTTNIRLPVAFRNKVVSSTGQNVSGRTVSSLPRMNSPQQRFPVGIQAQKTLTSVQQPEMNDQLSERLRKEKMKLQAIEARNQQNSCSKQVSTGQQLLTMNPITPRNNSVGVKHERQQDKLTQTQKRNVLGQKVPQPQTGNQQHNSDKKEIYECSTNESIAYLEKIIDKPSETVVQRQIRGNTVKMLLMMKNGEQRLITFDIPAEDCTVQDLLEQANIVFTKDITISLVSDPGLGINYIVETNPPASSMMSEDEHGNGLMLSPASQQSNSDSSFFNCGVSDENSSSPSSQKRDRAFVEGKLAVCPHCGISSIDFIVCERCKRKLPEDVKTIPLPTNIQEKKDSPITANSFYKKANERTTSGRNDKLERDGSAYKRGRGRGRGSITRTKLILNEPECLTISSDDDDDGKNKKNNSHNNSIHTNNEKSIVNDESETILEKEPVITNNTCSNPASFTNDYNEDVRMNNDKVPPKNDGLQMPHTSLECRTVRIGSYKYVPRENVVISQNGIKFDVPLLEDDQQFVKINIKFQDIIKLLVHFGKLMPVLFLYTSTNTGAMIREVLGMQDLKGPYYDPAGKDTTHKRITLLPIELSDESKSVIKLLFQSKDLFAELSSKEANDILVRASPRDSLQVQNITRKSSQLSLTTNNVINGGIQTITVYPPPPAKGGIAINTEDYSCLAEDQFLNDVIIDFYLKYLTLEILPGSDRDRTHVFSSYFYKRLTSRHAQAGETSNPLSPAAKRHARVQKWTKNVNIFEKDFVIIPINENAHWFLAIICFPGLVGKISPNSRKIKCEDVRKTVQKSRKLQEIKLQAVTIGNTTITPVKTTITIDQVDDGSERDEAEGDEDEMDIDSDEDDDAEKGTSKMQVQTENCNSDTQEIVKIPSILIFDSLAGASRSRVVATLRDYLSCEHVAKMGSEKEFSKDTIKGASPKVPQQSNFTDCGLYVLQYVESFFKNPIKDFTLPIKTLKTWFEEIVVTRKREELSKLLIKLLNETKGDKNITLPVVSFPTQDGKLKPRIEKPSDAKTTKPDLELKKKIVVESGTRTVTVNSNSSNTSNNVTVTGRTDCNNESKNIYQTIPVSSATFSVVENNQTEMLTENIVPQRTSAETMSYLKSKRIKPRSSLSRPEIQDDSQAPKKHKGESSESCK